MSNAADLAKRKAKRLAKRAISVCQSTWLAYPKRVQCNICGWTGRHFLTSYWHERTNCPACHTGIRHRLPFAALQNSDQLYSDRIIRGKRVLHFAPETILTPLIQRIAAAYVTADFLRTDCDAQLDLSDMPQIKNESFDVVIAFDVLEHVPDYQRALEEIRRVLSPGGYAILTVPQKDNLSVTYEDPSIVEEEDRLKHFGQRDHLRIFGEDFSGTVESKGFAVTVVDESSFSKELQERHVLFPPKLSMNPLATNYRKVFFARNLLLGRRRIRRPTRLPTGSTQTQHSPSYSRSFPLPFLPNGLRLLFALCNHSSTLTQSRSTVLSLQTRSDSHPASHLHGKSRPAQAQHCSTRIGASCLQNSKRPADRNLQAASSLVRAGF